MTVHHTRALFQEVAALSNLPLCHTALSQRGIADIFSAIVRLPNAVFRLRKLAEQNYQNL